MASNINTRRSISSIGQVSNIQYPAPGQGLKTLQIAGYYARASTPTNPVVPPINTGGVNPLNKRRAISSLGQVSNIQYPISAAHAGKTSTHHIAGYYPFGSASGAAPTPPNQIAISFSSYGEITSVFLAPNRISPLVFAPFLVTQSNFDIGKRASISTTTASDLDSNVNISSAKSLIISSVSDIDSTFGLTAIKTINYAAVSDIISQFNLQRLRPVGFDAVGDLDSQVGLLRIGLITSDSYIELDSTFDPALLRNSFAGQMEILSNFNIGLVFTGDDTIIYKTCHNVTTQKMFTLRVGGKSRCGQ